MSQVATGAPHGTAAVDLEAYVLPRSAATLRTAIDWGQPGLQSRDRSNVVEPCRADSCPRTWPWASPVAWNGDML
jgi:hypothetical protein